LHRLRCARHPILHRDAKRLAMWRCIWRISPQQLTGGSPSPAVPIKSMYQLDRVAIRLTMFVSWAMRATGAVAYVPGAW
jgi:hypothetical protein